MAYPRGPAVGPRGSSRRTPRGAWCVAVRCVESCVVADGKADADLRDLDAWPDLHFARSLLFLFFMIDTYIEHSVAYGGMVDRGPRFDVGLEAVWVQ